MVAGQDHIDLCDSCEPPVKASGQGAACFVGKVRAMPSKAEVDTPVGTLDERELLLRWLGYLRGAVLRDVAGLTDEQARWRPDGRLICLLGIVNHLTHVEWRWIDGGFSGAETSRSEEEFAPGPDLTLEAAVRAYVARGESTDATVRSLASLEVPCRRRADEGTDLRWVLIHLINETARHAGHADAARELLDGTTGE
jgi:uncharacterized damage-inducible protein DinB